MLATKANVYFEGPFGELKNRYVGTFLYKKGVHEMKCVVEFMMMAEMPVEIMHEDIVQQINNKMCATYPYNELMEIEAMEPRAALARAIVDTANELQNKGMKGGEGQENTVPGTINDQNHEAIAQQIERLKARDNETWPQVVQRCIAQFKDKVTTLDVLFEFFEPVVRMFLERGYRDGFKEGLESGRTVFIRKLDKRIQELNDGVDGDILRAELQAAIVWLKQ